MICLATNAFQNQRYTGVAADSVGMFRNTIIGCFEWYLNCSNISQAGRSCQLISAKALPHVSLQTGFNGNLSTIAPVAMTNSSGLVNLLNIIAFCYFDKSIMPWFTYALGKIFIGTFYTKLSLVYTNKISGGLRLLVAFLFLNGAFQCLNNTEFFGVSKLTRGGKEHSFWSQV